ncbi:MAG: hypothetical protein KDD66_17360 [Bdellovibrionales bacterium]|nr:hypothetical protein [Bdellovibrionales bacterium]
MARRKRAAARRRVKEIDFTQLLCLEFSALPTDGKPNALGAYWWSSDFSSLEDAKRAWFDVALGECEPSWTDANDSEFERHKYTRPAAYYAFDLGIEPPKDQKKFLIENDLLSEAEKFALSCED